MDEELASCNHVVSSNPTDISDEEDNITYKEGSPSDA